MARVTVEMAWRNAGGEVWEAIKWIVCVKENRDGTGRHWYTSKAHDMVEDLLRRGEGNLPALLYVHPELVQDELPEDVANGYDDDMGSLPNPMAMLTKVAVYKACRELGIEDE